MNTICLQNILSLFVITTHEILHILLYIACHILQDGMHEHKKDIGNDVVHIVKVVTTINNLDKTTTLYLCTLPLLPAMEIQQLHIT